MSTDIRGKAGGKSEWGWVNDHSVSRSKSPHRDRPQAVSFLSVMMHPETKGAD